MKRIVRHLGGWSVVGLLALLVTGTGVAAAGPRPLPFLGTGILNGSFEDPTAGQPDLPDQWSRAVAGTATVTRANDQAFEGSWSAKFDFPSTAGAAALTSANIAVVGIPQLQLTWEAKGSAVLPYGVVAANLVYFTGSGQVVAGGGGRSYLVTPAWQAQLLSWPVPAGAVLARLTFNNATVGQPLTFWVDAVVASRGAVGLKPAP